MPWRAGCEWRERAWEHLKPRYDWPVIEAAGPEPWCKAVAVTPAIESAPDGIVVVADADVWCDELDDAVEAVESGEARWAVPHGSLHRLTETATANCLSGRPDSSIVTDDPYGNKEGVVGGGIVVGWRRDFLEVPLDPRFIGWGNEDEAWGWALTCLLGEPWRGTAGLWHYWHPPQPRMDRKRGSMESSRLRRRYAKARWNPDEMRALIEEGRLDAHPTPESAVHAGSSHR